MARYVDPHVDFYIRATGIVDPAGTPPEIPQMQELRKSHDLGLYTVEELEELLETLGETLTEWVGNNPPHEPE
jgi:hypothetical protein